MRVARAFVAIVLSGLAAGAAAKDGDSPLFATTTPLKMTLDAPWPALLEYKLQEHRHPAKLTYTGADGQPRTLDATVETRGLTRRRVCRFPPLRLRFAKGATAGSEFAGQDELKMVTHCDTVPGFADYYVQEQLAYRIWNLVSERSFRVRPLEVTYRQPDGARPNGPRYAFVIEELGDVAKRNGLKRDKRPTFRPGDFDPLALSRLMLFQYLIGNTDWDVTSGPQKDECCHNTRVLAGDAAGLVAVPYDFDSAGMVNANYAAPAESLGIESVRERVFRGFCVHNDALPAARREFQALRPRIEQLVRAETQLEPKRQRALLGYFEGFYATIDDDAKFAREITGKCRK